MKGSGPCGLCASGLARATAIATATVLAGGAGAQAARAATSVSPFATLGYQYNSNVFMRPSSLPPMLAGAPAPFGDTILDYEGGATGKFDWGPNELTVNAEATRDDYDRFSLLSHTEYQFGGDFHWRLGPIVDGTVKYQESRFMAPFTTTFAVALLLDTQRVASSTVRILVSPAWRVDLTPQLNDFDTPLPGYAGFRLYETEGSVGLDYLGFGPLTSGVELDYYDGRYAGIVGATKYTQRDAELTASYKVSGLSSFSADLGYTSRDSTADSADSVQPSAGFPTTAGEYTGLIGTTSSVTGSLSYRRQLTGKTSAKVSLFRNVESYAGGANPEIGTGGAVGVTWKPDVKFDVDLNYSLTRDQIEGGLVIVNATNQTERIQSVEFAVRYAACSWLTIRPYVSWDQQTSTFTLGNYSATIVGVEVTGRLQW